MTVGYPATTTTTTVTSQHQQPSRPMPRAAHRSRTLGAHMFSGVSRAPFAPDPVPGTSFAASSSSSHSQSSSSRPRGGPIARLLGRSHKLHQEPPIPILRFGPHHLRDDPIEFIDAGRCSDVGDGFHDPHEPCVPSTSSRMSTSTTTPRPLIKTRSFGAKVTDMVTHAVKSPLNNVARIVLTVPAASYAHK